MFDQQVHRAAAVVTLPADIIDVVQAGWANIARCQAQFTEAGQQRGDPGYRRAAQAITWSTVAGLIELHLSAEDGICILAV